MKLLARGALVGLVLLVGCGDPDQTPRDAAPAKAEPRLPHEVELVCAKDGNSLSTELVEPRPDGVHLVVNNRLDYDPGLTIRFPNGGGEGHNLEQGRSERVLDAGPGKLGVACYPKDVNEEPEYLSVRIVDPEGLFVDSELDCEMAGSQISDYAETPEGDPDPEAVARDQLSFGLQEGDELRRAGYPESNNYLYVVVRGDRIVARTELNRGTAGWYTDGYDACSDFAA